MRLQSCKEKRIDCNIRSDLTDRPNKTIKLREKQIDEIKKYKNWDGAESKTRPSNLPDINLNQSELTRDTYLVRVNPHKSSSNSRK
jgi:hypothetical protein